MSVPNAQKLFHDAVLCERFRDACITECREELWLVLQSRVATFNRDKAFITLATELSGLLGCSLVEAGMLLHPVCKRAATALGEPL
jgi:hypothetical protein